MEMARRKCRLGWFGMLLLASVMMFGCGGGGGDDDGGGGGSPAPDVPTLLSYGVGATNTATPLLLPNGTRANGALFAFSALQLSGMIDRGADPISITLDDYNTDWDAANVVQFTYNPAPAVLGGGPIIVRVTIPSGVTIRWLSGADPTEGSFVVSIVNAQGGTALGPFTVVVAPGGAGVNIYDASNNPLPSLSWDAFKNAETASGVDHQVLTSLAYNMLQATYRWLSQAYTLLSIVVEYDALLQQQQVVGFSGDNFPGTGAGPANITVQWLDQNTNSDLGPGDGFMSNLSYWWDEVAEFIYNGHLRIIDYWENSGAAGDNYVGGNFRFGPDSGDSDFTEYDPMGNVYDPNGPRTTIGGSIFFLVYW